MIDILKYLNMYKSNHPEYGTDGARIILYADGSGHFEEGINENRLENFDNLDEFIRICEGTFSGNKW